MSKSLGYYTFSGSQSVLSGGILPLVNTVRQYGRNVTLANNGALIRSTCGDTAAGYYNVSANATLTASAAGTVTVSLYQDGQLVPGATQTFTAAANGVTNFSFNAPVRVFCGQSQSTLALYVTGQTVTATNVAMTVTKE